MPPKLYNEDLQNAPFCSILGLLPCVLLHFLQKTAKRIYLGLVTVKVPVTDRQIVWE
jgi:hypothetical protein